MKSTTQKHGATTMNHTTSTTSPARNRFGFKKRQPAIVQPGRDEFVATIQSEFRKHCLELSKDSETLTYFQAVAIGEHLRKQYRNRMGHVPVKVEVTLQRGEAMLATTRKQVRKHTRNVLALVGSGAGAYLILSNLAALGWKAGVLSSMKSWVVGTSLTGPIASVVGGAVLVLGASYFVVDGIGGRARQRQAAIATERYMRTLCKGLKAATPMTWVERHVHPLN